MQSPQRARKESQIPVASTPSPVAGRARRKALGFDVAKGTLRGHSKAVWTCDIAPDGRRVASGSCDRAIHVSSIFDNRWKNNEEKK